MPGCHKIEMHMYAREMNMQNVASNIIPLTSLESQVQPTHRGYCQHVVYAVSGSGKESCCRILKIMVYRVDKVEGTEGHGAFANAW